MISSKRITLLAFLLMGMVVVLTFVAIFFSDELATDISTGTAEYSDEHKISLFDNDYYASAANSDDIVLNGATAATNSRNVQIEGGEITIFGGGYYKITGELTDGSIIINSEDANPVFLVLDNASVTSSDFSAIYVKQAAKVVISAKSGTTNYLADAIEYSAEKQTDMKPDAVIYSKDNLTINGDGILNITGNFADGIKANDDLKIIGANINITAADEGINANNYTYISKSTLNITSSGDGVKCEEESSDKGFIVIENSMLDITTGGDGVSASSSAYIKASDFNIVSGDGSQDASSHNTGMEGFGGRGQFNLTSSSDTGSTKGIKAEISLNITDGGFYIDSADDALHSNSDITITGGSFVILSGDDAVHADNNLILAPATMDIQKCYEGLEGAYITINNGNIKIISSDDGINATGLNSSGGMGRMMMQTGSSKTDEADIYLTLNGGNVYIEASGDGFDSNGSAVINDGSLQIFGPENNGNGSIDVGDGGYVLVINGGTLFAAGSSGMTEAPDSSSTQNTIIFRLDEYMASGSEIAISDSEGNEIISGISNKKFDWVCVSDENIRQGTTYILKVNGEETVTLEANDVVATSGTSKNRKMR